MAERSILKNARQAGVKAVPGVIRLDSPTDSLVAMIMQKEGGFTPEQIKGARKAALTANQRIR